MGRTEQKHVACKLVRTGRRSSARSFINCAEESGMVFDTYICDRSSGAGTVVVVTGSETGVSLRITFHLTHRASNLLKSLARIDFHWPRKFSYVMDIRVQYFHK